MRALSNHIPVPAAVSQEWHKWIGEQHQDTGYKLGGYTV